MEVEKFENYFIFEVTLMVEMKKCDEKMASLTKERKKYLFF